MTKSPMTSRGSAGVMITVQQVVGSLDQWICRSLDRWICGSLDRWICGSLDLWIDGSVDRWICRSMDLWIDGSVDRWICTLMDLWIVGSVDRQIVGSVYLQIFRSLDLRPQNPRRTGNEVNMVAVAQRNVAVIRASCFGLLLAGCSFSSCFAKPTIYRSNDLQIY